MTLATNGDSASISVVLLDASGSPVHDGTLITVTANGGTIAVEDGARTAGRGVVLLKTRDGLAAARFWSGDSPGNATVDARSGSVRGSLTLTLSALVAPSGSTLRLVPERALVAPGEAVRVLVLLTGPDGSASPNGTRVAVTATAGVLARHVVLTSAGAAEVLLTVPGAPVTITLHAQSGSIRDSTSVTVQ